MAKAAYKPDVPVDFLHAFLAYDASTGILTWKWSRGPKARRGDVAGCLNSDGYIRIGISEDGYKGQYRAHRVAWAMMTGAWPEHDIDHRDLNRANNAWANLRMATTAENCSNSRARSSHKKGAYPMVSGRWSAQIRIANETIWLGTFDTEDQAHQAYFSAAVKARGEYARSS